MYGYKRGALDGKPLALLLSPHAARCLTDQLAEMVIASTGAALPTASEGSAEAGRVGSVAVAAHPAADVGLGRELVVVGMHIDRVAFPVKLMLRKASGVGEDSTFLALMEPLPPSRGLASLWVSPNGTVTACDPQFVANFGWRATEVQGSGLTALLSVSKATVGLAPGQAKKGDEEAPLLRGIESSADLLKRLLARAKVSEEDDPDVPTGLQGLAGHKYDTAPVPVTVSIVESAPTLHDAPIHEVRVRLVAPDPPQLMVVSRKGAILHASTELAVRLKDAAGRTGHGPAGPLAAAGGVAGAWAAPEVGGDGAGVEGGGPIGAASGSQLLTGFKLPDFLPSPWKEMHVKLLKDTTAQSPPARSHWSCRQGGPNTPGPTLELRTITGQPLRVTVSVTTRDLSGEPTHVIRMGRSSLPAALAERRVRLSVGADGVVVSATEGPAASMLRLEPTQVVGRGLWELITEQSPHGLPSGPPMLAELMDRAIEQPGHSWRVQVVASAPGRTTGRGTETGSVVRVAIPKSAVMQVFAEGSLEEGEAALAAIGGLDIPAGGVVVDLWPATNVSGVLQLDATGRVSQVLEEATRPAGLLFGMPSSALVGSSLAGLVVLPPGRSGAQDLLTLTGAKKSSLKKQQGEAHVVAMHADSEPLTLDVQVVGKPGPGQTTTVILRPHAAPMMPAAATAASRAASFAPAPRNTASPESRKVQTGATLLLEPPSAGPAEKPELAHNLSNLCSSAADSKSRGPTPPLGTAPAAIPPSSPANPTKGGGDSQPASNSMSGSATGGKTSSHAAPHKRISDMVARCTSITLPPEEHPASADADTKAPAAEPMPPKAGSPPASGSRRLSAGIAPPIAPPGDEPQQAEGPGSKPHTLPGSTEPGAPKDHLDELEELLSARPQTAARGAGDHDSEAGDGSDSEKGKKKHKEGEGRVSQWVASKGAFYQNSVAPTHKSEDVISEVSDALNSDTEGGEAPVHQRPGAFGAAGAAGAGLGAGKGAAAGGKGAAAGGKGAAEPPPEADIDDGASDGGQSAMSAQSSSGGAEYKRGKRFRKLARLMDSNQAQQVQHRFRTHAVITVLLLAAVHLACFILTITIIDQKRDGMIKLGDSGQAGLYMHQMLTDVRSLDVISRNMTIDYLYTAKDADFFIQRVAKNAEIVKESLNHILEANHGEGSPILHNLYYTTITVWNGWEADGSDSWINVTVWDFATRFYAMAKNIEQHAREWLDEGLSFSDQFAVGFLLRSGPMLYQETREVMDALVDKSVKDVEVVDTLQLVFLAVEGAAITCLAACYLAYLLRAVAAQRYKLYGTFLLIPVGLTRALASQDINAVFNDEEDSDDDDDGPRELVNRDDEEEGGAGAPKHQKRRATLAVRGEGGDGTDGGGYGEGGAGGRRNSMLAGPEHSATFGSGMRSSPPKGRWGKFKMQMRHVFRRNSGSVSPLPVSGGGKGGAAPPSKRQLKNDSNDTAVLLVPFLLWSALVIGIYLSSVIQMKSIVDVVAIHAVSNFMSGRTYRTIYYSQELAVTYDPAGLPKAREDLAGVLKLVRDAWYTLQLGKDAYLAAGDDAERFQMVTKSLAYASPGINKLLHSNGYCHRQPVNAPCPGPAYRFNKIIHTGLDSMMSQFLISAWSQAANKSMVPEGLEDEHFDFIYNVGTVDLIDGNIELEEQHIMILNDMYDRVILLHIILFVMLWIIFAGFLFLLLNPLLHRITKERRRIAELMSQLPLELDVEKLVERALVVGGGPGGNGSGGTAGGGLGGVGGVSMRRASMQVDTSAAPVDKRLTNMSDDTADGGGMGHVGDDAAATTKWKAIIREASLTAAGSRKGGRSSVEM
ncbi:hypothetical protein HYH03_012975 [Edaphochlamys debaryana]|uniref:Uncharacterized protein n=1 Tax=Edaphochlamys debaryana TaxID=47281 RepID=A0A836BTL4_9CHLO|nr:hypothetical protein HYH03_012975 [Edaphochlamys debaryana]|eukprot:KAG2488470.1 hypothetical protein HYH03_012975 [Edaphochlamys debaryana]